MVPSDIGISSFPVTSVGGIEIQATTPDDAANWVVSLALRARSQSTGIPIRLSNAYCLALAQQDADYRALMEREGVTFPDGRPVAWVANHIGAAESQQVRGPQLFERVIELGVPHNLRHFFYGTTEETLAKLRDALQARYPGVIVAGTLAPPFASVDELASEDRVEEIRTSRPDILWVGLGTPKQDFVAAKFADLLGLPVLGVGAAFDFSAGTLDQAPAIVQRLGLEWAFRFAKEPRRLWRRYLIGNSQFIALTVRELSKARAR